MIKLPSIVRDPFWQAVASVLFIAGGLGLLLLNNMGTDCFFAGGCVANTFFMLSVAATVLGVALAGGWVARLGFEGAVTPWLGARGYLLGEGPVFVAVLAVAGVLRLGYLGSYPAWLDYDTAQNGWIAMTLWEQLPTVQPVLLDWATGNETAYIYLVGASLQLFGVSVEALRLPSALVGTATVAAIYLLGRTLFSARLGLIAAFFAALCPWHIMHSRMATRPILTALFVALGLLLLYRGLLAERGKRSWAYLVACGLLLGAGLHGYEAFRLFPLAVAAGLVWTRFRQGLLRRGMLELLVVAGCAFLVTLPIFIFALVHPEAYMEHVSTNSIIHAVREAGSLRPLLDNLLLTFGFMVFGLPSTPHLDYHLVLPLLALAPLFLGGLLGLVLARKAGNNSEESRKAGEGERLALARLLVLITLVLMAAPFLLARFSNLAPRRYMGEMVPFYLLAGGAAVGILRGLRQKIGPWGVRVVCLLSAAGMLAAMPTVAASLAQYMPYHRAPRAERVLRWCLTLTAEHEIYLAPGVVGHGYLSRFFLKHPRVHRLPTAWPLPDGPLSQDVLLVSRGEPWWVAPLKKLGAVPEEVKLDLPLDEPKQERLTVYWVSRDMLSKHRLTKKDLREGFSARLLISSPGVYSFRAPGGRAGIMVDATSASLSRAKPEVSVALAAGRVPIAYRPDAGTVLQWRVPGAEDFSAVPAARLWRLPGVTLPRAPAVKEADLSTSRVVVETSVPVFDAFEHNHSLQDLACGRDHCYIVDLDRYPVKRWTRPKTIPLKPVLFLHGGKPVTLVARYDPESFKSLSLAVSRAGFFLLEREKRHIRRFALSGESDGLLPATFSRPVDLTATDEALYVADPGHAAVLECTPSGKWEGKPFVSGVDPVAVAARDGRLAFLDRRRHQLRVVDLETGKEGIKIQLGQVNNTMRLDLAADGTTVLTDPVFRRVLIFDARGNLLAREGDPLWLGQLLAEKTGDDPSMVLYDSAKRELTFMGRSKGLVVLKLSH